MWAVIPVKRFDLAKQRLSSALPPSTRAALAAAMLEDVLAALARVPELEGRLVISQEPAVAELAARHDCGVLAEDPGSDLCRALEQAARHLEARQVRGMLIVPGDVPLLQAESVRTLLALHRRVTVVPDRDGLGTNCLIVSPPRAIEFRFGEGSCQAHQQAAHERGLIADVRSVPELALDVDSAEDLSELQRHCTAAHTRAVLDAHQATTGAMRRPCPPAPAVVRGAAQADDTARCEIGRESG